MNNGYVIARKKADGEMGQPVGNDDGAVMLFEEYAGAKNVRDEMQVEVGPLSIFKANIVFAGEVF